MRWGKAVLTVSNCFSIWRYGSALSFDILNWGKEWLQSTPWRHAWRNKTIFPVSEIMWPALQKSWLSLFLFVGHWSLDILSQIWKELVVKRVIHSIVLTFYLDNKVLVQCKPRTELESVSTRFACIMHQHFSMEISVDVKEGLLQGNSCPIAQLITINHNDWVTEGDTHHVRLHVCYLVSRIHWKFLCRCM